MKILLIYKTKTGFTEKYANWITEEINCDIEKISNIQNIDFKSYDLIIYGSRIHAGRIDGLDKIKKLNLDNKLIVFATRATPKDGEEREYKNCIAVEKSRGTDIYMYAVEQNRYLKMTIQEFAKQVQNGLIHEQGIPRLRQALKELKQESEGR